LERFGQNVLTSLAMGDYSLAVTGYNTAYGSYGLHITAAGPTGATPLPGALPLFGSGLGLLGLLGWRRKRKNAAALATA
jgi:PEP-CTERM motif